MEKDSSRNIMVYACTLEFAVMTLAAVTLN